MSYNNTKYCVNCENPLEDYDPVRDGIRDFCNTECERQFTSTSDPEILARESNTNSDALPTKDIVTRTSTIDSANAITQSLLQLSGMSQEAIGNIINTTGANSSKTITQKLTQNSDGVVKNNSQNDTD
jgi:hypothetical protein